MTTHLHTTVPGQKLFYRDTGAKLDSTIILLHGFRSSSHTFRESLPQFSNYCHEIAPDYFGFGCSNPLRSQG